MVAALAAAPSGKSPSLCHFRNVACSLIAPAKALGTSRVSIAGHAGGTQQQRLSSRIATPWLGGTPRGSVRRTGLQELQFGRAASSAAKASRTAPIVAAARQNPGVETATRLSEDEEKRSDSDNHNNHDSQVESNVTEKRPDEETHDKVTEPEEGREKQRRAEQAGVSGSEDGTAPGNGIGRANLLTFSLRQHLLMLSGGRGKGGGKDKGDGKDKGNGKEKGGGKEKGDKAAGGEEEKGEYVRGLGRIKTLQERTDEKRARNKEVITKAKAGMKARGEQRGMSLEMWSDEKQAHWEEYRHARAAYLKEREAQKPKFELESYADPGEVITGEVRDPAGPNPRTFQTEEGGILSEEERQRLQPITKPAPDPVIHKVGRPYRGEWGINPNSAGWAPGNADSPDTGSHRGELNKYGEVATLFPYGTWIGERFESTFEAAPLNNNSPYWSLNHRPTVSQSVTITQHKASNHVKGGERITSSLAGLCNPANKVPPRDGELEIFKQRSRNRLTDESSRSRGVSKASYEGQSEEEMYGLREGTLPDSLNIIRKTRDAAEWMAKDSPAFTEMSFTRGLVSKAYKNAVVDKMAREKMQEVPPIYMRRLGNMTRCLDWSFEVGYKYNQDEYEDAKAELQQAIDAEEDEEYIRKKRDEVDMLAKRVEQEKRTLPGKPESLSVV